MRKILQNKIGVSCLAALALLCVAGNFVNFPKRRAMAATARESTSEEVVEESFSVPPASRLAAELRAWQEMFSLETVRRDPFAAVFVAPPAAVTNVPTVPSFQLQAVSLAGGKALAVINQRVVAEGETIEGCRVEKILRSEVRLISPLFGPVTATFDRTPNQSRSGLVNKSPSENLPAAVLPASRASASSSGSAGTDR